MSAIRVFVLVLLLGQVTGVWSHGVSGDDDCEPGCADDDAGKDCPPACPTCACACAMRLMSPAAETRSALVPPVSVRAFATAARDDAPASPDPREILHVPRRIVG